MFNPAKASQNIRDEFIDYISTAYYIEDNQLRKQFRSELERIISKGPIIELSDIFVQAESIEDLIKRNVLSDEFSNLEIGKSDIFPYNIKLPLSRPLHKHQVSSIEKITSGDNVVVSTGTGSGKTECFLIPIINFLMVEKLRGNLNSGVRAVLIYPMNALANDQLKRIREILLFYPDITFGVYNGSTKHDDDEAEIGRASCRERV